MKVSFPTEGSLASVSRPRTTVALVVSILFMLATMGASASLATAATVPPGGEGVPVDDGGVPCDNFPNNGLPDCGGGGLPPGGSGIPCYDPNLPCDHGGGGGGGGGGGVGSNTSCKGTLHHVSILSGIIAQAVLDPTTCPTGIPEQARFTTGMARAGCDRDTVRFRYGDVMKFFRASGAVEPHYGQCYRGGALEFSGYFRFTSGSDVPTVDKDYVRP